MISKQHVKPYKGETANINFVSVHSKGIIFRVCSALEQLEELWMVAVVESSIFFISTPLYLLQVRLHKCCTVAALWGSGCTVSFVQWLSYNILYSGCRTISCTVVVVQYLVRWLSYKILYGGCGTISFVQRLS